MLIRLRKAASLSLANLFWPEARLTKWPKGILWQGGASMSGRWEDQHIWAARMRHFAKRLRLRG
jgi:hypothetical protein